MSQEGSTYMSITILQKNFLVKSPTRSPSAGSASSAHVVAASNDHDPQTQATSFAKQSVLGFTRVTSYDSEWCWVPLSED